MEWLLLILGLFLGGMVTKSVSGSLLTGLAGAVIGLSLRARDLRRQLQATQRELQDLSGLMGELGRRMQRWEKGSAPPARTAEAVDSQTPRTGTEAAKPEPLSPGDYAPPAPAEEPSPVVHVQSAAEEELTLDLSEVDWMPDAEQAVPPAASPASRRRSGAAPAPRETSTPRPPGFLDRGMRAAREWLMGGNPVLKVGILLLFLGLAFLLRYAAERVTLPVEFRYMGVAAVAMALLLIGWRLRLKRASYALSLQGAGVAILYLTVFAALHLHPLLTPGFAFALLLAVVVCATLLAVVQNALSLALVSTVGGFAAPLLTAVGEQTTLFSYYLLLNLGIVGVAWYRAWRPLNLVGLSGTFSIGLWWGLRFYEPAQWLQTELFLVAFFLLYLLIGLLFAHRKLRQASDAPPSAPLSVLMRWAVGRTDYIDATLLFGPPLVGFGMQYAVVSRFEFGPAYSALALGLLYLTLATLLWRRLERQRYLLVEVYLALGVIFGTLAVPLALDAQWTSAIWAVEGAGIYWVSLHQRRILSRVFALLLQGGAVLSFLSTLSMGGETLLDGPYLSALLIGLALLFSHDRLQRWGLLEEAPWERFVAPWLAVVGLLCLYLLPPLLLSLESSVRVWAVAGLLTLAAGLRLARPVYLPPAFAVQLLAGALFLLQLRPERGGGSGVLDAGWPGLFTVLLLGASLLGGVWLALRDVRARELKGLGAASSAMVIFGLLLINLGVLFVLPWQSASGLWAASGLAIVWVGMQLGHRETFLFGAAIQLVAGAVFLQQLALPVPSAPAAALSALSGAFFWSPAVLSLVAFAAAALLQRHARRQAVEVVPVGWGPLASLALVWGAAWWAFTLYSQIVNFTSPLHWTAYLLLGAALSAAIWSWPARRYDWTALGMLSLAPIPVGMLILLAAWHTDYHPAANLGWLGWLALFAAHGWILRRLDERLPGDFRTLLHLLGVWLLLGVLSLELRYLLMALSEHHNAWRWLGWAAVPSLYLMLITFLPRLPWPVSAYPREYRVMAALPVAGLMLAWVFAAAILSDGSAQPLPYLPVANPLTLSLLWVLFALLQWGRGVSGSLVHEPIRQVPAGLMAAALFLVLTSEVFRTAHHWLGIPFRLDALLASRPVQAGLSLLWTLMALAAMVFGTRRGRRRLWIAGAVLIGVVVVKLFLVELSQHGSVERILSFIGVGVLLLVVGYFSPLPPKREGSMEQEGE